MRRRSSILLKRILSYFSLSVLLTVNFAPSALAFTWSGNTEDISSAVHEITDWEPDGSGNLHVVGYSVDGSGYLEYIKYNKISSGGIWGSWITISSDFSGIGSYPDPSLIQIELTSAADPVVMYAADAGDSRELRVIASAESSGGATWDLVNPAASDGAQVVLDNADTIQAHSASFVVDTDDNTPHIFLSRDKVDTNNDGFFHVEMNSGTDVFDATFDDADYDSNADSAYIGNYKVVQSSFEEGGLSFYGAGVVDDGDSTYDVMSFTDAYGGWNLTNNILTIQADTVVSENAAIDVTIAGPGKQVAVWTLEGNGSTNKVYYAVQQDPITGPQSSAWNTPVDVFSNMTPEITNIDTTFGTRGVQFDDNFLSASSTGETAEFPIAKIGATSTDLDYVFVEIASSGASNSQETIDSLSISPGQPVGPVLHLNNSGSPFVAASVNTNAESWDGTSGGGGAQGQGAGGGTYSWSTINSEDMGYFVLSAAEADGGKMHTAGVTLDGNGDISGVAYRHFNGSSWESVYTVRSLTPPDLIGVEVLVDSNGYPSVVYSDGSGGIYWHPAEGDGSATTHWDVDGDLDSSDDNDDRLEVDSSLTHRDFDLKLDANDEPYAVVAVNSTGLVGYTYTNGGGDSDFSNDSFGAGTTILADVNAASSDFEFEIVPSGPSEVNDIHLAYIDRSSQDVKYIWYDDSLSTWDTVETVDSSVVQETGDVADAGLVTALDYTSTPMLLVMTLAEDSGGDDQVSLMYDGGTGWTTNEVVQNMNVDIDVDGGATDTFLLNNRSMQYSVSEGSIRIAMLSGDVTEVNSDQLDLIYLEDDLYFAGAEFSYIAQDSVATDLTGANTPQAIGTAILPGENNRFVSASFVSGGTFYLESYQGSVQQTGGAVPEFSTYVYVATLMLVFGMLYKKDPEVFAFVGEKK